MALTRHQKEEQVVELTEQMKKATSIIFAHYIGLTVADITKLRSSLRKENAEMKVAKKSLIRIAAKLANAPEVGEDMMPGPVACIFSMGEPTGGASAAYKFAKDHAQVKLIGGIFSGKVLSAAEANEMATIPSKLQLIGMFMSMCNSPLTKFVSACNGPLTSFARAMSEVAKQKESATPKAAAAPASVEAPVAAAPVAEAAAAPTA